ncbi:hypothetical protein C446_09233 [Halobiforma nitratireducens JCM 10879]|uniref:Uncharacterized protein n=2 Tax=Halobiforma nitratireducens TaxID=130048 RepID=M0M0M3_9EURY|nr:hypothetical protein C446_09233 [Halobiforma nitratireducens JCM 10879]
MIDGDAGFRRPRAEGPDRHGRGDRLIERTGEMAIGHCRLGSILEGDFCQSKAPMAGGLDG